MASLLPSLASYSKYKDRHYKGTNDEYRQEIERSSTLYVGNLSFYTTEEQIYELFSKSGEIKRIIMGLDRFKKTPCGFCFVEYYRRQDALDCMLWISGSKLDDRLIRTDLDCGFKEGRQYGRGNSGGQVRDERRADFDSGRGGWSAQQRGQQYDSFDVPVGRSLAGRLEYRPAVGGMPGAGGKRRFDGDDLEGNNADQPGFRHIRNPRQRVHH